MFEGPVNWSCSLSSCEEKLFLCPFRFNSLYVKCFSWWSNYSWVVNLALWLEKSTISLGTILQLRGSARGGFPWDMLVGKQKVWMTYGGVRMLNFKYSRNKYLRGVDEYVTWWFKSYWRWIFPSYILQVHMNFKGSPNI